MTTSTWLAAPSEIERSNHETLATVADVPVHTLPQLDLPVLPPGLHYVYSPVAAIVI